jgi:hypothetical protein
LRRCYRTRRKLSSILSYSAFVRAKMLIGAPRTKATIEHKHGEDPL